MRMKRIHAFFIVSVVIMIFFRYFQSLSVTQDVTSNIVLPFVAPFPVNLHIMYLPWKQSKYCPRVKFRPHNFSALNCLKDDIYDFNKTYYYSLNSTLHSNITLHMWTLDNLKALSDKVAPGLWETLWEYAEHPTMIVDFYRWFVVYELGGIYWQYESINHVNFFHFFPSKDKQVLLLTEKILSDTSRIKNGKRHPIRQGQPEESLRISNQVFGAYPKSKFIRQVLDISLERIKKYKVNEDYDILYIGANAMISEVYNKYENKSEIQLIPLELRKLMVSYSSKKSWNQDMKSKKKTSLYYDFLYMIGITPKY